MWALFRALFAPPRDLILLLLAGWLGLALADWRARSGEVGEKSLDTLVFSMLAAYLAAGRLAFLAAHMSAFLSSPSSAVSLSPAAFDLGAGLLGAGLAGVAVIQRKRLPAWQALDLLAPLFACLAVGLALSDLASGAAFGSKTQLPWAIQLWGARRHPTQVYELLAALAVLAVIWFWRPPLRAGSRFLLWIALAAASRLFIEGFRGDSILVLGGLRLAQVVAWLALAGALAALELRQSGPKDSPGLPGKLPPS